MQDASAMTNAVISAILDNLLPGDNDWPAAGQHGLGNRFTRQIAENKQADSALEQLLDELGNDFVFLSASGQTARLESAEITLGTAFEHCVTAAYAVYYTDPEIRRIIEKMTGYPARPPQPLGYKMEPFDESLLDTVRQRAPFWRQETD